MKRPEPTRRRQSHATGDFYSAPQLERELGISGGRLVRAAARGGIRTMVVKTDVLLFHRADVRAWAGGQTSGSPAAQA